MEDLEDDDDDEYSVNIRKDVGTRTPKHRSAKRKSMFDSDSEDSEQIDETIVSNASSTEQVTDVEVSDESLLDPNEYTDDPKMKAIIENYLT